MMATFLYRTSDIHGNIREEVRDASCEEALLRVLASQELYPLSVRSVESEPRASSPARAGRYSMRSVRDFTDGIALMIRAGLSVRDALDVAKSVFPESGRRRGEPRRLIDYLHRQLDAGAALSEALDRLGDSFPPVYLGLVRIGERVGTLEAVLSRLAAYLQDQKRMRDKIMGALAYPLLVLAVALVGTILVPVVVVPKAGELFNEVGAGLPQNLQGIVESAATALTTAVALLAALIGLLIAAGVIRRRGGRGRVALDRILLRLPGLGSFFAMRETANLTFALETLAESGVPVEEALREASLTVDNHAYREALEASASEVIRGALLSRALLARPVLPERLGRWVAIGERTGHVESVFKQLRLFYQADFEKWSMRVMNMVEPALIVAVGIVLLFLVLTFVVPLFSLYGTLMPN